MPQINGRDVISRADIVARGVPATTARRLYRERAANGHPESAGQLPGGDGRTLYWYQDEWDSWYAGHANRRDVAERDGDPDELVDADGAADILGYASGKTVTKMLSNERFATPDEYVELLDGGRPSPRWKRRTLWEWADGPLRFEARGGARERKQAKTAHLYAGDKRLEAVRGWLAAGEALTGRTVAARLDELGPEYAASGSVAAAILATARKLAAEQQDAPS